VGRIVANEFGSGDLHGCVRRASGYCLGESPSESGAGSLDDDFGGRGGHGGGRGRFYGGPWGGYALLDGYGAFALAEDPTFAIATGDLGPGVTAVVTPGSLGPVMRFGRYRLRA
jgi:hypothetical protein